MASYSKWFMHLTYSRVIITLLIFISIVLWSSLNIAVENPAAPTIQNILHKAKPVANTQSTSAQQLETMNCSESTYKFQTSPKKILDDEDVVNRCGIKSSFEGRSFLKRDDKNPLIKTKCGVQRGKLVSFVQASHPESNSSIVPNVVHYVYFGNWTVSFLEYLSFKSVHKFLKPKFILIHGDAKFHGQWWSKVQQEVANLYVVHRTRPTIIQGQNIVYVQHSSDITRLQTQQG